MEIVSLNTGLPREVVSKGRTVTTGIYKSPVDGRVPLRRLNLDGDRQADLTVHGGAFKAVYCYPVEHYAWWTKELTRDLDPAMFGENFTTRGLDEDSVHVGDEFAIGTARVVVTQPRLPCYKLGIRFQSDDMIKRFLASGRTGFYLSVAEEGEVGAGDAISVVSRDPHALRISDVVRLYVTKAYRSDEVAAVKTALGVAALPDSWKKHLEDRLAEHRQA